MDGGKPLIACDTAATAVPFQVIKKLTHDRRCQVFHGHPIDGLASADAGEWQQQCQCVAITGLGVPCEVALGHHVLQQEAADPWADETFVFHRGSAHCA